MLDALQTWFGLEPDQTIGGISLRSGLPLGAFFLALAVALGFTAWTYSREAGLSRTRRVVLTLLRSLALCLLIAVFFAPVLLLERHVKIRRNLLVLLDQSESMAVADKRQDPADVASAALALGQIPFELPAAQESLTRSQRLSQQIHQALLRYDWNEARERLLLLTASLAQIQQDLSAAAQDENPQVRLRAEAFSKAVREITAGQQRLRDQADRLQSQKELTQQQRCQELRDPARQLSGELNEWVGRLTAEPLTPPEDAKETVSRSRLELAQSLLQQPKFKVLERIAQDFNVRYFLFGEKLEEVGVGATPPTPLLTAKPSAQATKAERISEAVTRDSSQPIAGVVVLSDGGFNDETFDPLNLANAYRRQGIPLYTVGIGLPAPRDVRIDPGSLVVQEAFFPKDKITAQFQVSSRGYSGATTEARLLLNGVEVGKCPLALADEPRYAEITFTAPEVQGGSAKLELIVPEQTDEAFADNNRVERTVKIIDQKIKVLYVEGNPRWEYRYLRALLLRDPRLEVRFLMTRGDEDLPASSPQYLARFPTKPDEAFAYDMIILGDVPSWYFSREQLATLEKLVRERSGALLMLAGDRFAPVSYVDTPLADLLPVKINSDFVRIHPSEYPSPTARGKASFTQLEKSDEANEALWSLIRPLHRLPRITAKESATVLAELPISRVRTEPYPLIAWQQVGAGKVMYVGLDQLWRLRFKLGDQYHGRFWGQATQFLALSRLLGENKRIYLHADRTELSPGGRAEITARVLDESFQPVKAKEFSVRIQHVPVADAKPREPLTLTLAPVSGTPGLFQGITSLSEPGTFRVTPVDGDPKSANPLDLAVADALRERQDPTLKEITLKRMAEISGGRYLTIRDWPTLGGLLEGAQHEVVQTKEIDLWDRWGVYALFVACVGVEWLLRRRSYLM